MALTSHFNNIPLTISLYKGSLFYLLTLCAIEWYRTIVLRKVNAYKYNVCKTVNTGKTKYPHMVNGFSSSIDNRSCLQSITLYVFLRLISNYTLLILYFSNNLCE